MFNEAAALGVLQVHFSGGEPLVRRDLVELVADATKAGLYVNLITSGIRLEADRLARLVEAGLEHVQLSLQDSDPSSGDRIAGLAGALREAEEAAPDFVYRQHSNHALPPPRPVVPQSG